jgi:hypothetical protein
VSPCDLAGSGPLCNQAGANTATAHTHPPRVPTMTNKRVSRANTRHIAAMLQLASQSDLEAGIEWYARAERLGRRLSQEYGCTFEQAVGVIAALSPSNRWLRNCQDAEAMIKAWSVGTDPSTVTVCTYSKMRDKATKILALVSPDREAIATILNGRKITAFFLSITGQPDAVCVDGHAYAIWIGERVPTTKTPSLGVKLYAETARAYCLVAKRSASLCGEQLTPAQVQAVTWVTYRRLLGLVG